MTEPTTTDKISREVAELLVQAIALHLEQTNNLLHATLLRTALDALAPPPPPQLAGRWGFNWHQNGGLTVTYPGGHAVAVHPDNLPKGAIMAIFRDMARDLEKRA